MKHRPLPFSRSLFTMLAALGASALAAETPPADGTAAPAPVVAKSVQEEAKSFQLPPGYRLEPVLSEPEIKEPGVIAFDGDGRMFVAELRTYMQDIDGKNQFDKLGRVSLHWSSKGDGVYDKHTVFIDQLVLPRMLVALDKGRIIVGETNTNDLFIYADTDGDGVSDKKEPFYVGGGRGGNLEHQPNGMVWALDNGLYSTYNDYRLRWTPTGAVKEKVAGNGGQWGLCQDNFGKLLFMNAGGEQGPRSFQQPVLYGAFNPGGQFAPGFDVVWPLVGLADVQGGGGRFRKEDKTLNHFTATCGSEFYRGDRLPAELRGDLFFGEPVGRLVRRAKVEAKEGFTTLSNPYQEAKSEFLRSTDPCFRPVNCANAPDGTLYIVDMYRGIIQEGNWVRGGSYLRGVVEQYGLQNVFGHGRIWRLVHTSMTPGPQPRMNTATPAQLVAYLGHPNGWWRDTAQKLLVLKQDKSVVAALTTMARTDRNEFARLHALWTLEGLGALTPALVRERLKDNHPQLRIAALRVGESLFQKGEKTLGADVMAAALDKDTDVAIQSVLTAKQLDLPEWPTLVAKLNTPTAARGVKEIVGHLPAPPPAAGLAMNPEQKKIYETGKTAFTTLCATCHGADAKGLPMAGAAPGAMLAPSLAGSKTINGHQDGGIKVLLHGLIGDIDGKKYEGQMIAMATNDDAWIAGVLSYVRTNFGNKAGFVSPADVAALRAATKARTQPWTAAELRASLPK
ncbi:MAG: c-type cytochrome [Chthoniobacter sp.]|nr:c-type cytochrome [Chthoniobacter sp.]